MLRKSFALLVLCAGLDGLWGGDALRAACGVIPVDQRCEYVENPLGVDMPNPRLFWKLDSGERGQFQTAYQILVASTVEALAKDQGDLWDS